MTTSLQVSSTMVMNEPVVVSAVKEHSMTTKTTTKQQPIKKRYSSDLIVLLDIDRTMIYSSFFNTKEEADEYVRSLPTTTKTTTATDENFNNNSYHENDDPNSSSSNSCTTKKKAETVDSVQDEFQCWVRQMNLRPGLKDFLHNVCTTFETHIFTAATKEYAESVASLLDPMGIYFAGVWSKEYCQKIRYYHDNKQGIRSRYSTLCKDLSKLLPSLQQNESDNLKKKLDRVVLIDDRMLHLITNPGNVIVVKEFKDDPHDRELEKVQKFLMEKLKDNSVAPDVRPILKAKAEKEIPSEEIHFF